MKKVFKIIIFSLASLLLLCALFFFWASSPTLSVENYNKITINNFKQTINNDSIYSIITYNIGYLSGMTNNLAIAKPKSLFDNNLEKVISEFKTLNPDFIALQEIDYDASRSYHVNQQTEIASLGYNYVAEAVNWDDTYVPYPYWPPSVHFGKTVSGQSILSKYPIENQECIVLERVNNAPFYRDALYPERLAQIAIIKIENKNVILINVHLEAFDKATREKQFATVLELFTKYAANYPTILLGDFNSDPKYTNAAVTDILNSETIGNAAYSATQYDKTYNSINPDVRIDYIFYSKNSIEYIDGKVLNQFEQASDHLPVEMRFKLK
ncbi:endonuclease/exonuclease/phosphatase family protein [Bizionia arctica]|uniref:Endonuclease n=1 Tax=Bizionia arctica TaxID=1495645 RepID=A0A917LRU1_9FLAO|nr:endonuclease/exonuclease/phosphatase family protein [Bizionia arctica]GGG53886.1 endonuclease [Bizionia arctica]